MPREKPCPFQNQPANIGGHLDASIGEKTERVFELTYTPADGTDNPHAPCTFHALSQQALAHQLAQQEINSRQTCPRCARTVGVSSVKRSPLAIGE